MSIRSKINNWVKKWENDFEPLNIIEISQKNILHNFDVIQKLQPTSEVWPVLKSNAYGHGLKQIVEILKEKDFKYFIVDSYYEALRIWEVNKHPVLLMGTTRLKNFPKMKWNNLAIMVQDKETVHALGKLNKKIVVHLKINTGMNRQGVNIEEVKEIVKLIKKYPKLILEGAFSHLADADSYSNKYTLSQLDTFNKAIEIVEKEGVKLKYCHLAATSGLTKIKDKKINAIRLGIGLYGFNPLNKKDKEFKKMESLKPALIFKSVLTKTTRLKKGEKVSYNGIFTAPKDMNIGVVPVGYFEALDRRLSNAGWIKYKNKLCPIIGRICMNMAIIDLGSEKGKLFDEVEVISDNSKDKNSIISMAGICNTIPYEILVKINGSVRRIIK